MTDVIRSSQQGDAHGGAYLIDLESGTHERVLDWESVNIDWDGRGMGRGLRGIAFVGDEIFIAASDELFVFDHGFNIKRSYTNPYLHHAHEIDLDDEGRVLVTSTSHDSILRFDPKTESFDKGWYINAIPGRDTLGVRVFDPSSDVGPPNLDTLHINQVSAHSGSIYIAGVRLQALYELHDDRAEVHATTPDTTHNCRPFGDHVLMNATAQDSVVIADKDGTVLRSMPYPKYDASSMTHTDLSEDYARQGFGRGLCVDETNNLIIAGSSPGTVTAFDSDSGEIVRSVNVSMDIRNAPHGLELWAPDRKDHA